MLAVAVPQLATGLWAVLAPRRWFDDFPGIGPALVGAEPPYNQHLATDAGGAFLATGVALVIAVIWPRRQLVMLALVTYLTFSIPHAIYHAAHEAPGLSGAEDVMNLVLLFSGVALAAALLWGAVSRTGSTSPPSQEVQVSVSPTPPSIAVPGMTRSRHGSSRSAANAGDVGPSSHAGTIAGS